MNKSEIIREIANILNKIGYDCCRCMDCKTCKMAGEIYEKSFADKLIKSKETK